MNLTGGTSREGTPPPSQGQRHREAAAVFNNTLSIIKELLSRMTGGAAGWAGSLPVREYLEGGWM